MIILFKEVGQTPLGCVKKALDTKNNKCTYVGRLDPMADGLLLVLENEECADAEQYRDINKTYEYKFIVGIQTDTYDCLGQITKIKIPKIDMREKILKVIAALQGTITLPYPPYSSRTVDGKPLFEYARQKTLHTITVPETTTKLFSHKLNKMEKFRSDDIKREILSRLKRVPDGFRREEAIADWHNLPDCTLQCFSATLSASSGTYVRAIVNKIGEEVGYPATAIAITRTQIGRWKQTGRYTLPRHRQGWFMASNFLPFGISL